MSPATTLNHADGDWHRVHPISPVVRSWLTLVAIIAVIGTQFTDEFYSVVVEDGLDLQSAALLITAGAVVAVLLLMVGGFYLSWRFYRYRITEEMVQVHSGWIFRQQRHVRLDRVQAIDIKRPLLARIFGLAELSFEAADGGGSAAMTLAFIRGAEAEQLRVDILQRAAGVQKPAGSELSDAIWPVSEDLTSHIASPNDETGLSGAHEEPAPEQTMLTVPTGRLVWSILLTAFITIVVLVVILVAGILVARSLGEEVMTGLPSFAAAIPIVVAAVAGVWSPFSRNYNFTVSTSPNGLRLRSGLLETRQQTVPPGRVQSILISQSLLWRPFGWYRVRVTVAGYGMTTDGKDVVLPVGTFDDVLRVLTVIAPDPGTANARELIQAGLTGTGSAHGFVTTPRRMRVLDPLTWRRQGFAVTPTLVLFRTGRLTRYLCLMSHERIQSAQVSQGPIERRLGVVNVHLHTPAGPATMRLNHVDAAVASQLFFHEADIAAVSRRIADRNQWMMPEELQQFDRRTEEARRALESA
ncbi:PH domain-containing protein [Citricoccus sp. NR2]|uniref:PH domain-containing protein n=1 Tax=Citricoccus sp. NR2 TaxID=3004095 RepID=UPI0022DD390A|nr:PH domain-containing protein [Citricoccus sp. NR2]WBL19717.1 PH domain-containing protein [Citricoccus sp. NR2]